MCSQAVLSILSPMEHLEQFEALFNYATVGIILCNDAAEIINFNAQAETQFGYSKEEVLGQKIEMLLPEKYRVSHVKDRDRYYEHPGNRIMGHGRDLQARRKDGSEFPVEVSLSTYRLKGSLFVIAFVIDISVRKKNELEMVHQREALERASEQVRQLNTELEIKVENRTKMLRETLAELEKSKNELTETLAREKELGDLKSGFVTMASHEFRTPLSTILSSAFLLSKYNQPDDAPKRDKHVARIKDAVNGMKNILEDFLSLGKLEEGSVEAKMQCIEWSVCCEEIEQTVEDMRQLAKTGQEIVCRFTGSGEVNIDVSLLKNILINLLSNAIKFSPEQKTITVNAANDAAGMSLSVADQGIGIAKDDQEHLFERFFRAGNAVNIQGTGLGLHIISKYISLMQGSIEMKSELEKGTVFTIHIPNA